MGLLRQGELNWREFVMILCNDNIRYIYGVDIINTEVHYCGLLALLAEMRSHVATKVRAKSALKQSCIFFYLFIQPS